LTTVLILFKSDLKVNVFIILIILSFTPYLAVLSPVLYYHLGYYSKNNSSIGSPVNLFSANNKEWQPAKIFDVYVFKSSLNSNYL